MYDINAAIKPMMAKHITGDHRATPETLTCMRLLALVRASDHSLVDAPADGDIEKDSMAAITGTYKVASQAPTRKEMLHRLELTLKS
ncbi:hypothetical protein BDR03DRAFT_965969 [Suillus americanus]|nr:hypothetical protein BDR03DRAFT_965969 [Suillus americanus]